MSTTHSDKALKTLELLGTEGKDWLHPAVEWKLEKVKVVGRVTCPDCQGEGKAFYTQEQAALPREVQYGLKSTAPTAFVWPKGDFEYTYSHGAKLVLKDAFHKGYGMQVEARRQYAAQFGVVEQDCRRCYRYGKRTWSGKEHGREFLDSHGTILAIVEQEMWVGYIQWPAGVAFGVSRFACGRGNSRQQCELCAKGINKSGRVPLVTLKDGKPRAMWVGQDCARKFTGVIPLKPTQDKKAKKHDHVLADNYEEPTNG